MSEVQDSRRTITLVAVIVVVGLLLSLVVGALAGGVAGYFIGRQQGRNAAESAVAELAPENLPPSEWQEVVPQEPDVAPYVPMPRMYGAAVDGALVRQVVEGTPAEEAGLRPGDVIISVDGQDVAEVDDLRDLLQDYQPGDRVELGLWSQDTERTVLVRLGEHPDEPGSPYLGIYYVMLHTQKPANPQD
jgi:serine protease DegQ